MSDFRSFAAAVHDRLEHLTKNPNTPVFVTTLTKEDIWDAYLKAFPEGTNPIFRERTEHDCSCCRNFIKNLGRVVTLRPDGSYQTVWDVEAEGEYAVVAAALSDLIRQHPIESIYRTKEPSYGAKVTYEAPKDGSPQLTWHHFYGATPKHLQHASPGEAIGEAAATHQVLSGGLKEFTLGACETVEELIATNSLYRGEEHHQAVKDFTELKRLYDNLPEGRRALFVWQSLGKRAARFKNTAIGTLVQDISEGMAVDAAVGRFEAKVAPQNYKRSSAVITQGMVDKALADLRALGLESAVQRRFATVSDIDVNDVLFVDRSVRPHMRDSLADLLASSVKPRRVHPGKSPAASDITIDEFLENVLPGASSVELMLDNGHLGNFVSLTAPVDPAAGRLFSWDNGFAWAYDGDIADSDMRKAVRAAGGSVNGAFRFTHSWNYRERNASLMDLHVFMPGSNCLDDDAGGMHDRYGNTQRVGWNNRKHATSGGSQDVDYVNAAPPGHVPVENITFPNIAMMPQGRYVCRIHNWQKRQPNLGGFKAEIEFGGRVFEYEYAKPLNHKEWVTVAIVTLKDGAFTIEHRLPTGSAVVEKWGLTTGQAVPVDMVVLSPNHWGPPEQRRGNRHHIFVLRGAKNPDRARGFFNEFLRPDLHPHRKVFEVLGAKTMCAPSDSQVTGVGFSSTKHDRATFIVRKDDSTRTFNVQF